MIWRLNWAEAMREEQRLKPELVGDGKARTSSRLTRHMEVVVEEGAKHFKSHETGIVGWKGRCEAIQESTSRPSGE